MVYRKMRKEQSAPAMDTNYPEVRNILVSSNKKTRTLHYPPGNKYHTRRYHLSRDLSNTLEEEPKTITQYLSLSQCYRQCEKLDR